MREEVQDNAIRKGWTGISSYRFSGLRVPVYHNIE
jgi:hypothetical protein